MEPRTTHPRRKQYVEVIAVTAGSGYDANTVEQADAEEKELPSTVTLLVTPEQSKILAMLEADGTLHVSLVYRGDKENAAKFTEAQALVLTELYPDEPTDDEQTSSESEVDSQPETPAESEAE